MTKTCHQVDGKTITISTDLSEVNWETVPRILKRVGMGHYSPAVHRKAFENSYATVFAFCEGRLIGFGRAVSDDAYQAALYDMAVIPEFQGRGIGTLIMKQVLSRISSFNIILYASPGKEDFYRKLGFRKMKTGMARFVNGDVMKEKGFSD